MGISGFSLQTGNFIPSASPEDPSIRIFLGKSFSKLSMLQDFMVLLSGESGLAAALGQFGINFPTKFPFSFIFHHEEILFPWIHSLENETQREDPLIWKEYLSLSFGFSNIEIKIREMGWKRKFSMARRLSRTDCVKSPGMKQRFSIWNQSWQEVETFAVEWETTHGCCIIFTQ